MKIFTEKEFRIEMQKRIEEHEKENYFKERMDRLEKQIYELRDRVSKLEKKDW